MVNYTTFYENYAKFYKFQLRNFYPSLFNALFCQKVKPKDRHYMDCIIVLFYRCYNDILLLFTQWNAYNFSGNSMVLLLEVLFWVFLIYLSCIYVDFGMRCVLYPLIQWGTHADFLMYSNTIEQELPTCYTIIMNEWKCSTFYYV